MSKSAEDIQNMANKAAESVIPAHPEIQAQRALSEAPVQSDMSVPAFEAPSSDSVQTTADQYTELDAMFESNFDDVPEAPEPAKTPEDQRSPPDAYEPPPFQVAQQRDAQTPLQQDPVPEAVPEQPQSQPENLEVTPQNFVQPEVQEPQPEQPRVDPALLRQQTVDHLMNTQYALSEDDKDALLGEPGSVLPRIAAGLHVNVVTEMAHYMAEALPRMIQSQMEQTQRVQKVENDFFSKYPTLNKPEYTNTVKQSLSLVRQAMPQATRDEVMERGAMLAATTLRQNLAPQQAQPQPARPAVQMPMGGQTVPQQPFSPVQSSAGVSPIPPAAPPTNIFTDLANDPNWD